MNAKLCKTLRKQALDASPVGAPARRLIAKNDSFTGKFLYAINGPGTVRGYYRQLKAIARRAAQS